MQIGDSLQDDHCCGGFGSSMPWTDDGALMIGYSLKKDTGIVYYFSHLDSDAEIRTDESSDYFALINTMALDESIMLVGTYNETNGKAHLFTNENKFWKEVAKISVPSTNVL